MGVRKVTAKIPQLRTQTRLLKDSINVENRTVEMVFTTTRPVRTYKWEGWDVEEINEVLSMEKDHIRLERMEKGAPLLDSHQGRLLSNQIGVVEKVWIDGEQLRGQVRFSKKPQADEVFQDVVDGIIRNGSIGYQVHKYDDISEENVKIRTLKAIDWEPVEMSFVPIPADHDAQVVRSNELEFNSVEINLKNESKGNLMKKKNEDQTPIEPTVVSKSQREEIAKEEREKAAKIVRAVRQAKLPEKYAEEIISSNVTYEKALEMIQEKWAENESQVNVRSISTGKVDMGGLDETETRREGMAEAILHRMSPSEHEISDKSRKYAGMPAMHIAREICEANGLRTVGLSVHEIARRSMHSTSDFPLIMEDVANKRMQKGYQSIEQVWRQFGTETTLKDFKTTNIYELGEAPLLEKIGEGAEVKMGTVGESKESYRLYTYAKGLKLTREMLINDDMNAFGKIALSFGRSAASLENQVALQQAILDNPVMGDGTALFHADHKNLIASGGAPSATTVSNLKKKIRKQLNDQSNPLHLKPKFILGGPETEDDIRTVLAGQNVNGGYNIHANSFQPLVSSDITGNDYYMIADPNQIEVLEYAYLEGARGIQLETLNHADNLGLTVRAFLDFAAKVINYRGIAKNPGA